MHNPSSLFYKEQTLFSVNSKYHRIAVGEYQGRRFLRFGEGEEESACNLANPDEAIFEYPALMAPALALKPDTRKLLLVGMGGGYMAGLFQRHRPDIQLTVVEIDPVVCELAHTYFEFKPSDSLVLIVADGRDFLEKTPNNYDQIWLDAYDGNYIPAHLRSSEFVQLCCDRLTHTGVLVQNVHNDNALYMAHKATMSHVFGGYFLAFGVREPNAALIAQKNTPGPRAVKHAFSKGLQRIGSSFGGINMQAELGKIRYESYIDKWAVLYDENQ